MKYCGNCGAELKNNAKFCANCGTKCSTKDLTCACDASKEGTKKSTALIIGIAAILIAIVAGIPAMLWHTSPEQKALRLVASRDYTSTLAIIQSDHTLAQSEALARKINDRILFLQSGYEEGSIEYETVCTELDAMEQLGIQNTEDQLKDTRQTVYELYCERNLETFYLCTSQIEYYPELNRIGTTWTYDEQGRLIEYGRDVDSFDPEYTDYSSRYSYVYDDNGRIKKGDVKDVVNNEGTTSVDSYTFVAAYDGDLPVEYTDRASENRDTIRFAYDENGNMISGEVLDYNGDVETAISMHYDGNGILREIQKSTIIFQSKTKTSYDENGRMVEMFTQLGENGDSSYHCTCDYNEQGKLTCSTVNRHWETGTETTSTTRYEYNDRGMLTAMGREGEGDSFYSLGKWSDSNHTVEFTYVQDNSATITYEYEYDEAGNCIRHTCYRNGELESQTTYTYIALQLPSNYKVPSEDEPRFLQF